MSSRDERKAARRAAHEQDKAVAASTGSAIGRKGVLVDDATLDKLVVKVFTTKVGDKQKERKLYVRLLPFHPDDPARLGIPLYIHYNVGPESDTFLCPHFMVDVFRKLGMDIPVEWTEGRCPECEEYERELVVYKEKRKDLAEEDRKKAYGRVAAHSCYTGGFTEKKPKSMLTFVVDADNRETENEGVQVFIMPYQSVYKEGVLEKGENPRTGEFIDLQEPEDNWIFAFKREGKGREDTKYYGYDAIQDPWQIKDWKDVVASVPRVHEVLRFAGYDEIAEAASGIPAEGTAVGRNDNGPVGEQLTRGAAPGRRSSAPDIATDEPPPRRERPAEEPLPPRRRREEATAEGQTTRQRREETVSPPRRSDPTPSRSDTPKVDEDLAERVRNRRRALQKQAEDRAEPEDRREPDPPAEDEVPF